MLPEVVSAFNEDGTRELVIEILPERLLALTLLNAPDITKVPEVVSTASIESDAELLSVTFPDKLFNVTFP